MVVGNLKVVSRLGTDVEEWEEEGEDEKEDEVLGRVYESELLVAVEDPQL